jgi:exodeoxyribonuclease VII small subunit
MGRLERPQGRGGRGPILNHELRSRGRMPRSSSPKTVDQLSYEAAFEELQSVIAALEGEQRSLDEATSLFERGQALVKRCGELLDQAELKVRQLSGSQLTDFEEG